MLLEINPKRLSSLWANVKNSKNKNDLVDSGLAKQKDFI